MSLAPPAFHHLHLNSVDPDAAIDFYTAQFPTTTRTTWGGFPALASPNDVLILFTQVSTPPPTAPQSAIWHFGWHVPDARAALQTYRNRAGLKLLPLYTGDADGTVLVSSDTWPGTGGILGRTIAQIGEAKASGVEPTRSGGFAYMAGPDNAIVEYAGNHPAERFNHVHMFQEDPLCAELWYQRHLGAALLTNRTGSVAITDTTCHVERSPDRTFPALEQEGLFRSPSGGVAFGDVWLPWYMRQGDQALASTQGNLYDHIALGVTDLDAWRDKLQTESVPFLRAPYRLGATRALMVCGPSQEAIELVEVPR
ncbi:MAG TPA: VOC family protein [Chloroflexota bacterium]|nr:VOC family protein [Chloroflexota bacterium]